MSPMRDGVQVDQPHGDRKSGEGLCADVHNRCIDFDTFGSAVGRGVAIGWNDDAGYYLACRKFMF